MRMSLRTIRYVLWGLVVVAGAAVAGVAIGWQFIEREPAIASTGAQIGGPFELVGVDGEPVSSEAFAGKARAVFFGFTHCPEVCPTTLFEAGGWLDALGEDADELQMIFVTVDPERDTPEALKEYMSAFDPRIVGLTGSRESVDEVIEDYKVHARKAPLEGGGYTMDHTASVLLFDSEGAFRGTVGYNEPDDATLAKLKRLVGDV